ncbi:MAG: DUF2500 domain-containing protein [Oscillospiraceae bacterium]|nr:DUF2500 domain-containing protein [Oscillospiraceae bacterium]
MFPIITVIFVVGFALVFGLVAANIIRGGMEWGANNSSPVLTVVAKVVAKRTAVGSSHHHHGGDASSHHFSSSSTYFATFEVESGDRMELKVPGKEYGMLAEGDTGNLTFQGTRYKGFDRNRAG